jgi:hypothetical protein
MSQSHRDATSRNETIIGFGFAMPATEFDTSEQTENTGAPDAKPACMALVPVVASAQWPRVTDQQLSRADPTFVTHLIATAEHVPQTCSLRRATVADAEAAYRSVTDHNHATITGLRTRQTS